jgi:hypothetical protein
MLIDPDHADAVQAGRVGDQQALSFAQDRVVGRVPGHRQPFGDAGHGQVLDHDADQPPAQPGAGDLGPWLRRCGGVLTPHVRALGAPVAAHGEQQRGGAPPERLVRQFPGHGVSRDALAAAPPAPVIRLDHPAGEHGAIGLEQLARDLQTEAVQTGEGRQVGAREGSVGHVEVFRMAVCRNLHLRKTSTPTSGPTRQRRLHPHLRRAPKGPGQTRWAMRWKPALNAFAITFADRMPTAQDR